jgi:hypothetical protein
MKNFEKSPWFSPVTKWMCSRMLILPAKMGFELAKIGFTVKIFKATKSDDDGFVQGLGIHQTSVRGSFTRWAYSSSPNGWID